MKRAVGVGLLVMVACGGGGSGTVDAVPAGDAAPLPTPSCDVAGGDTTVSEPMLIATLFDRWHEAWLGSVMRIVRS